MHLNLKTRFCALICLCASVFSNTTVLAATGVEWLLTNQMADGSFAATGSLSTTVQSTSEAAHVLAGEDGVYASEVSLASSYLSGVAYHNTENLTRLIESEYLVSGDAAALTSGLLAHQNPDGGFGEYEGYNSTAIDTAYALISFADFGYADINIVDDAIVYLLQRQLPDGSFILSDRNQSSVYITSLCLLAFQKHRFEFEVENAIQSAVGYLISNQQATGGWGTAWESAVALRAVAASTSDNTLYADAVQWLRDQQQANGAWNDDVYTTALALQALSLVVHVEAPEVPTVGEVIGRTVNADTGDFLAQVDVSIDELPGTSVVSQSDGIFVFSDLPPSSYTLRYSRDGFALATQSFTIAAGQVLDIGKVNLTPLPDMGVVSGTVTDAVTGVPLIGALVQLSGVATASTTTNANGFYSFASLPGTVTVSISATDYAPETATGSVLAGGTLVYSPALVPAGTPETDPSVSLRGIVVNGDTGTPVENALVQVVGASLNTTTAADGSFSITGITAGDLLVEISRDNFQSVQYTSLANEGCQLDTGIVRLFPVVVKTTSTITGTVRDAESLAPISGAWVSITDQDRNVTTGTDGRYSIEGVTGNEFTLSVSATGFLGTGKSITVSEPTNIALDINLDRAVATDFDIIDVHIETGITSYKANTEVEVDAILFNGGTEERKVRMYYKVLNQDSVIVAEGPVQRVALDGNPDSVLLAVPAAQVVETEIEWFTGRSLAGTYQVIAQAYDGATGQLLAERGMQVNVEPTKLVDGHAEFDPPITQLVGNQSVNISATVSNQGNLVTDATTISARVTLKNQGFDPRQPDLYSENIAIDDGLGDPYGMDLAPDGIIYVANRTAQTVTVITPEGTVSEFASGFVDPVDVDVTASGDVYVLNQNNLFTRITADGNRTEFTTGLNYHQGIEALDDGRVLVSTNDRLYEISLTGEVSVAMSNGLANPHGMAMDSTGTVYIANTNGNSITQYRNGALSTFVAGINRPYGLTVDASDNLVVASYGDNSLLSIAPDKTVTTIATGLSGPYDVKIDSNGDYIVSNYLSSEIVRVDAAGTISLVAGQSIRTPTAMVYDNAGNLNIGNSGSGKITRVETDGTLTDIGSNISTPRAMITDTNGDFIVLESGTRLARVTPAGVRTVIASGLSDGIDVELAPDGNGYLVTESSNNRIVRVDASGLKSDYATSLLAAPRNVRSGPDGTVYMLSSRGYILRIHPDATTEVVVSGLNNPFGLAVDASGNIYTSENGTRQILKISATGDIAVYASVDFSPGPLTLAPNGDVLVAQYSSNNIFRIDPAGQVSNYAALGTTVNADLLADAEGNLWAPIYSVSKLLKRDASGIESQYTINDLGKGVESDGAGGVYVATRGSVKRITADGLVTNWITDSHLSTNKITGLALDANYQMWVINDNGVTHRFAGDLSYDRQYAALGRVQSMAYDNTNALVITTRDNVVLRLAEATSLPEVLVSGNYLKIEKAPGEQMIVTNNVTVKRLDLATRTLADIQTGYLNILSLAVAADGRYAVGDGTRNEVSLFAANDTEIDRFVGLSNPKGLAIDSNNNIYIGNSLPNNISRVSPGGAVSAFTDTYDTRYLTVNASGNLVVTADDRIIEIDASGQELRNARYTSSGLLGLMIDSGGDPLAVTEDGSMLKLNTDDSFSVVASGLGFPVDVETDNAGTILVADQTRGVIHQLNTDGSSAVRYTELPGVKSIDFDAAGTALLLYSGYHAMLIDTLGNRQLLPMSDLTIQNLEDVLFTGDNAFITAMPAKDTVVKITFDPVYPAVAPGELVYSKTLALDSLAVSDEQFQLDFGNWVPQASGDYLLEVSVDNPVVDGSMSNSLHVGPQASASILLPGTMLPPGDVSVNASLQVSGIDSTNVSVIGNTDTYFSVVTGSHSNYGITADAEGNIYTSTTLPLIRKIAPDGTITEIPTDNTYVSPFIMVTDRQGNIYFSQTPFSQSALNLYKLTPQGEFVIHAQMNDSIRAIALDKDDRLFAVDSRGALNEVFDDGTYQTISTTGFPYPVGMAIDGFGNTYVASRDGLSTSVTRVEPNGRSAIYAEQFPFEGEGHTIAADCSNNLLYTAGPEIWTSGAEEVRIMQLSGDTGETREIFYGPAIDFVLKDMDGLSYDRYSQRLLVSTDFSNGKIFAFPIICGGIDVEVHLVTRGDVDLSSTDPAPASVFTLADGTSEYVWSLADVTDDGQIIQLNMLFHNLGEGELRSTFSDAYLQFNNVFDPATPVRLPIEIPVVSGSSQLEVVTALDSDVYGPDALVTISSTLYNGGVNPFNGALTINVVDDNGIVVTQIANTAISALAPGESFDVSQVWNTGNTLAGGYRIEAVVIDSAGSVIAAGDTAFSIVTSGDAAGVISTTVTTDQPGYAAFDQATLKLRVRNNASNVIQLPSLATLEVRQPGGTVIYSQSYPVRELYPASYEDISDSLDLVDAVGGQYVATVTVTTLGGELLATDSTSFVVDASQTQGLVASMSATPNSVIVGEPVLCTASISNLSDTAVDNALITQQVAAAATSSIVAETASSQSIAAAGSLASNQSVDTAMLVAGSYLCMVSATVDGVTAPLAAAGFSVQPSLAEPPVANAGADQVTTVGQAVTLDGSASLSPDGNALSYQWSLVSAPAGSSVALDDPSAVNPMLVVDLRGSYVFSLVVSDGTLSSEADSVLVNVINTPPVAHAGPDQEVFIGQTAVLDGTASTDFEGDALSYHWSLLSKPESSLSVLTGADSAMPQIYIDSHGVYELQLVVFDGYDFSIADTVLLNVDNVRPVAHAGADQAVNIGQQVTLDGSASTDADGDTLSYHWSIIDQPAGSTATLDSSDTPVTGIVIDSHGSYLLQLVVNDGFENSEPDLVLLDVVNIHPVANAGADVGVHIGDIVTLDGSASHDADGDALSYRWSLLNQPAGSSSQLQNANTVSPSLAIDAHGMYIVQLIVNDGRDDSEADTVVLNVLNVRPVADAGPDQTVNKGSVVKLQGSGSDADGDALSYHWSLLSTPAGSSAALDDPGSPTPQFSADIIGSYIAQLIVKDAQLDSEPDTVTITAVNQAPVCDLASATPASLWAPEHDFRVIDIAGYSDADGDALTLSITSVMQDEPVNEIGDGYTGPDAIITTTVAGDILELRAERAGVSNGRVYHIGISVSDGTDSCTATLQVIVPHDGGDTATDDGPLYDSTQ